MPRLTTDRDTTWQTVSNNKTWTVDAEATIWTGDNVGILDAGDGNRIVVHGTVAAENTGIQITGNTADLFVGEHGFVLSDDFEAVSINHGKIVNHGIIKSYADGIHLSSGTVENHGRIEGDYAVVSALGSYNIENYGMVRGWYGAIEVFGAGSITNAQDGTIVAGYEGVIRQTGLANMVRIVNEGRMIGAVGEEAIICQGRVDLTNTGVIVGDIELGNGDDRIDTRGGVVRGEIHGGEGDDTYLVSSAAVRIVETGASFGDSVRSTASYGLGDYLDHLTLLGKADIYGVGNGGANHLTGNAGNNTLDGAAGEDLLSGGAGDDLLIGGSGADTFVFRRGFDFDLILGFEDGIDQLQLDGVRNQKQFDRLDIRQAGEDTVINLGKGDRLSLELFDKDDLSLDDLAA